MAGYADGEHDKARRFRDAALPYLDDVFTLARYLMLKNPAEARKLLDPLRTVPGPVGQVALQVYAEIPTQ